MAPCPHQRSLRFRHSGYNLRRILVDLMVRTSLNTPITMLPRLIYAWNIKASLPLKFFVVVTLAALMFGAGLSTGSLEQVKQAQASNDFHIQTGSYLGSGAARTISGLDFEPELVIIKSDTAAGPLVWKSTSMPESVTAYLGVATADNTESQIVLTEDGFIVSPSLEVNTANVTYTFIALAGSDCTSGGAMCIGSYTGNGAASRTIDTGFSPSIVWVKRTTALAGVFRTSSMSDNHAGFFSAAVNNTTGTYFTTLAANGFNIGLTNNTNTGIFYFVAFKNLAAKTAVGMFTGNGTDNRNITGLGFEPDFVFVKQDAAVVPAFNTTEMYGDYSSFTTAAASAVNNIQELQADGFQVGNSTSVNANTVVSHYFALGGSSDPTPSGSFLMERGSYVGTGATTTIDTSFFPNLVFVKSHTAQGAVWSTSLHGDATEYFGVAAAAFTSGINITSGETGFSVGTHATVNSNGVTYEYVAFGNATSHRRGDGAEDFYIGSYTGNGLDARAIDHLGFTPSMVVVKRNNGTANQSVWKSASSSMTDSTATYFSATADVTNGTLLQGLVSGGFTLSTNAAVNAAGATYVWFAFAEGANFKIGSYTGNSTANREISGIGFSPDLVWTKRDTAVAAVMRSSSPTITNGNSQHITALANDTNDITALGEASFTVGNSAEVNTTGGVYRYAAWNSSMSASVPDQPSNVAPAASAIDQNLKPTLQSSTYADNDGNAHANSQWQVDDDADFSSPVWRRTSTSSEISVAVDASAGTFANRTELDHDAVYYWRVRYSDSAYSIWSTPTSFTTNDIAVPTNSSPASGSSVTSLTPVLTASAFSDPEVAHTASSSEWQISLTSAFDSVHYTSGPIAHGVGHAVPGATLSDRSSYFWRVRYQDSSGFWSNWSESTRFLVSESAVKVAPLFGGTTVGPNDEVNVDVQVKNSEGALINDAAVTVSIYDPAGTKLVNEANMPYVSGSKAVYRYPFTLGTTTGSYLYEVTASTSEAVGYGAANFQVRSSGDTSSLEALSEDILTNVEMLISGLVVVQSSVQDASASETAFRTGLANVIDDFYTNGTLVFTSGELDGLVRRISSYDGTTKTITLDPPAPLVPADGTSFTITSQNLRSEEQLVTVKSQLDGIESKIDIISDNVDLVLTNISAVQTSLSTVQTDLNSVRSSQEQYFTLELTDADTVPSTGAYRTTLTVRDFESNAVNASSTPVITIYDPERTVVVEEAIMTADATGLYSYEYEIGDDAVGGVWESRVSVDPDGQGDMVLSDIWTLSGSAPLVSINQIADTVIPSITAYATITNEGGMAQEYNYTWCVVAAESNQCGGDDDVYTASAAKLLAPDESYALSLDATVPDPGVYWLKLVVNYDSAASGASLQFTAVAEGESGGSPTSGSSGSKSTQKVTLSTLSREMQSLRSVVESDSAKLSRAVELLGNIDPNSSGFRSLLTIADDAFDTVKDVQNKITEMRTLSEALRQIIEGGSSIKVNPFMEWGSVKFGFLISNPTGVEQTMDFKSFLPEEVKPEQVLDLDGLQIDFDPTANMYYVHGTIVLGPKDSIVKRVRVDDVWRYDQADLDKQKDQAREMAALLAGTQYEVGATLLLNEIENALDAVTLRQNESIEPQVHILNYRENKLRLERAEQSRQKLQDMVVEYDGSRGIFGRLSGIQITSTWILIAAVVLGFLFLSVFLLMMWRHQMRFAERMLARHSHMVALRPPLPLPPPPPEMESIEPLAPTPKLARRRRVPAAKKTVRRVRKKSGHDIINGAI
jgi:hypothetical protein